MALRLLAFACMREKLSHEKGSFATLQSSLLPGENREWNCQTESLNQTKCWMKWRGARCDFLLISF